MTRKRATRLIRFYGEHAEAEGDHAQLGPYVLKNYATTEELQRKATLAAKKSLQRERIGRRACRKDSR